MIKFYKDLEDESILIINSDNISIEYNMYGYLYIDENYKENLEDYKEARLEYLEDWKEDNATLSEIKDLIEDFQDQYEYEDSRKMSHSGKPSLYVKNEDDEYVDSFDWFYDPYDKSEVTESDLDGIEYYEYWDGHNNSRIQLSGEYSVYEDITDDVESSFVDKDYIGSTKNNINDGGRWENYYYNKESKELWVEYVTCWQGELNSWELIESDNFIDKIFVQYGSDKIDELRPELREKYGTNLIIVESDEYINITEEEQKSLACWDIASKDEMEEVDSWVNDLYKRTHGGTFYRYKDKIISYGWSAFQGERSSYYWSSESNMKNCLKSNC